VNVSPEQIRDVSLARIMQPSDEIGRTLREVG